MNIIVTGGAGFIGNHLCRYLINQGNNVICIDNLYSGMYKNIEDITSNKFYFKKIDVTKKIDIVDYVKKKFNGKVDQIYHLACPASPKFYQKDPIKTIKTCVNGTINILDVAKYYNASVLLSSTSEIYGEPLEHPQTEEYRGNVNTLGIRACYDEGKRIAETIMMEYYRLYKTDIKIVRIFNTYGPNMSIYDGRVVINFIQQALNEKDITIYGNGSQTRSFCYISDTVRGLVNMMNSKHTGPFNIGNPTENTVHELAELIIKLTNSKSSIKYNDLPQDDPARRCPDIKKAIEKLNWMPYINLEDGLKKTIESLKMSN